MESALICEIRSGVARLVLNRTEKRNALTRELIGQLKSELDRIARDASVRVLLLEANGLAFCAGMDLGEMQQRAADPDSAQQWMQDSIVYGRVLETLFEFRVPTVAVVQGPALAGGMGLVLACDMVLASENAFFALPEPMRGITAAMVTPLLVHRVGPGNATFLLLSGQRITAAVARTMGLCHEIVAEAHLASRRDEWVKAILTGSPAALKISKQHVQHCSPLQVARLIDESIQVSAQARETLDAREGLAAFLEKRKPNWQPE
jgi:methylglutaconyl-CoA hydratase